MDGDSGGLLGLACCQLSSRFSEIPCLKGIGYKQMEQDIPCPPQAFKNVHKCAHLHTPACAYKLPLPVKKDTLYSSPYGNVLLFCWLLFGIISWAFLISQLFQSTLAVVTPAAAIQDWILDICGGIDTEPSRIDI